MLCWICQVAEATTGEHRIKRSDLKVHIGEISPSSPLYRHIEGARSIPIRSSNSSYLKYEKILCEQCNSKDTQPYDLAWETLSEYWYHNFSTISSSNRIWLTDVFPRQSFKSGIDVQLYFAKIMGCKLLDSGLPVSLRYLREAIRSRKPTATFLIAMQPTPGVQLGERTLQESEVTAMTNNVTGEVDVVFGSYIVGTVMVEMAFSPNAPADRFGLSSFWNATTGSAVIRLKDIGSASTET